MSTPVSIKTPGELAGAIPYLIGFAPEAGSLVYVSVGGGPIARVDMSDRATDAVDMLAPMWAQHAPERVALVIYTDDHDQALLHASCMTGRVQQLGGQVVTALRVHDGFWQTLTADDDTLHPVDEHPATAAEFVARGIAPFESRKQSEARLRTDDDPLTFPAFEAAMDNFDANGKVILGETARHLLDVMHRYLEDPAALPTDEDIPAFALVLQHKGVRDIAWAELTRHNATQYVDFFLHLFRRCPEEVTAPICGLLAFAGWLTGTESPLVWAAIDKALEVDPDYTMAQLVQHAMNGALNPANWEPMAPENIDAIWESLR